ncbi:MAG: GAF domain-containing protein [Desulfobulbaceae bacterium]|nr:GAF domain-containing protein [Desulfobulbaceae bacterium]
MSMKPNILLFTADSFRKEEIVTALYGYNVIVCHSDEHGMQCCREGEVYVVIIDTLCRPTSWDRLFLELRKVQPLLSGLLITDGANEKTLRKAYKTGFSSFIELPFSGVELRQKVMEAFSYFVLLEENARLRTLLPLFSLGEQFLRSTTEQEVLDGLITVIGEQTGAGHISVMLYDESDGRLKIAAARGIDHDLMERVRVSPGSNIAGWVYSQNKAVILNKETQEDSLFAPFLKRPEIVSAISLPMTMHSKVYGVINISQLVSGVYFSESDSEMLTVIAGQAVLALENVRAIKAGEEKVRMRTLFEQYVAPEVAELLINSDTNPLELGAVRDVTVMFADVRNFTGLAQRLELTELRVFLNELFTLFTSNVFQRKGMVDKFMGDAVLAIFGHPLLLDNSAMAAVETARLILKGFEGLRCCWSDRNKAFSSIDLGIGITRGDLFLGNVGSAQRLDYTVIGTEVNIAQRLAAETLGHRINITREVYDSLDDGVEVVAVGEVQLRGVKERVVVYGVVPDV